MYMLWGGSFPFPYVYSFYMVWIGSFRIIPHSPLSYRLAPESYAEQQHGAEASNIKELGKKRSTWLKG